MAKIPEYTRSVIAPRATPQMADLSQIGAKAESPLSAALSGVAEIAEKHRVAKETTEVNAAVIRNKKEKLELLDRLRQEHMSDPTDFSKRVDEEFAKLDETYAQQPWSSQAKTAFSQTAQQINLSFFDDNLRWQNQRQTEIHAEKIEQAVSDLSPLAFRYGKEGKDIGEIRKDVDATLVAASTFLPPETTAKMKRKIYGDVTETWLSGLAEVNPSRAKKVLDSKQYDEALGGDGLKRAYSIIESKEKQAKAEYTKLINDQASDIDLRIELSENPEELNGLLQQSEKLKGVVSNSSYNSKVIKINKKLKELSKQSEVNEKVTSALTNGGGIDLSDSSSSKAVDQAYKSFIETVQQQNPQAIDNAKVSFVAKLGAVPKAMQHELKTSLRSSDPQESLRAAMSINAIKHHKPEAINDVPDDVLKMSNEIITNINLGYDAPKAVSMAKETKALDQLLVDSRKQSYKDEIKKKSSEKYITSQLNSFFVNDPSEVPSLMIDEFSKAAEQEYIRVGDIETARKNALDMTIKSWGRTEIGGYKYMKNPPEKYYGLANYSSEENRKWIKENFESDMEGFGLDPNTVSIGYDPYKETKGQPRYLVTVTDENGVINTMIGKDGKPLYWRPNKGFVVSKAKKEREEGLK